jgi:hypothetical protein
MKKRVFKKQHLKFFRFVLRTYQSIAKNLFQVKRYRKLLTLTYNAQTMSKKKHLLSELIFITFINAN